MTTKSNKLSSAQTKKLSSYSYKSSKIRFLNSLGWTKSEIAKELGIIYQHVRNVLNTPVKSPKET